MEWYELPGAANSLSQGNIAVNHDRRVSGGRGLWWDKEWQTDPRRWIPLSAEISSERAALKNLY
jgi:hypothetical protein